MRRRRRTDWLHFLRGGEPEKNRDVIERRTYNAPPEFAVGELRMCNGDRTSIGWIFVHRLDTPTHLRLEVIVPSPTTLRPGLHAFHLHKSGDTRLSNCTSACDHFAYDDETAHGDLRKGHAGDFENVRVDEEGRIRSRIFTTRLNLKDVYGRTMILHAATDDLGMTDHPQSRTTGNAGARVAFAVMGRGNCRVRIPPCLTCGTSTNMLSETSGSVPWARALDHVGPKNVTSDAPSDADMTIRFRAPDMMKTAERWIFWAAQSRDLREFDTIRGPLEAYGTNFSNCGVVNVVNGMAEISLRSPQPYFESGILWPRHVHLRRAGDVNSKTYTIPAWSSHHQDDVYSCKEKKKKKSGGDMFVTYDDVVNMARIFKDRLLLLNATGNDVRLNLEGCEEMSKRFDDKDLVSVLEKRSALLPVVVYCANSTCTASSRMIARLMDAGVCTNMFHLVEGYEPHVSS